MKQKIKIKNYGKNSLSHVLSLNYIAFDKKMSIQFPIFKSRTLELDLVKPIK